MARRFSAALPQDNPLAVCDRTAPGRGRLVQGTQPFGGRSTVRSSVDRHWCRALAKVLLKAYAKARPPRAASSKGPFHRIAEGWPFLWASQTYVHPQTPSKLSLSQVSLRLSPTRPRRQLNKSIFVATTGWVGSECVGGWGGMVSVPARMRDRNRGWTGDGPVLNSQLDPHPATTDASTRCGGSGGGH